MVGVVNMPSYLIRGNHLPRLCKCCAATSWIDMIESKYVIDGCGFTSSMVGFHNGFIKRLINRGLVVHVKGTYDPFQYRATREAMDWYYGRGV